MKATTRLCVTKFSRGYSDMVKSIDVPVLAADLPLLPVWINQSTNGLAGRAHRQHWSRCAVGLIEKWVNTVCVYVRAHASVFALHHLKEWLCMCSRVCVCACVCIPVCSQLIHPSACVTSPGKLFISVQALPAWIICLPYKYLNVHRSLICTDTVCL